MKLTLEMRSRALAMRRRAAVALAAGGLVLTATVVAAPAEATFPGGDGRIAFVRGGNIYTASATGGSIKRVTAGGLFSDPQWSPDGRRLTYLNASGVVYVRTMATGKTITIGTATGGGDPVWSGDGTRVAWVATIPDSDCDQLGIYSAPSSGNAAPTLMYAFDGWDSCGHAQSVRIASWSPDGKTILVTTCFASSAGGIGCILLRLDVTLAQAGQYPLTELLVVSCDDGNPSCINGRMGPATFGPRGIRVLFSAAGGEAGVLPNLDSVDRVYAIDINGTNLHQVSTATSAYDPTASPTGTSVLFTQDAGTTTNIMKSGVDATSRPRVLIKNAAQADWQPTH